MTDKSTTIYVSPAGDDIQPGTQRKPVQSPAKALELARRMRLEDGSGAIEIVLLAGRYRLTETLVLGKDDAGSDTPLVIRGEGRERTFVSSAVPVASWEKADHDSLPGAVKGRVWRASVPPGIDFRVLHKNTEMVPRARGKGFQPTLPLEGGKKFGDRSVLHLPVEQLAWLKSPGAPEVFVRPHQSWLVNYLDLVDMDYEKCSALTSVPATYRLDKIGNMPDADSAWLENVLAVMAPECPWVLDKAAGALWLYSEEDPNQSAYSYPALREYIRIEGENDEAGDQNCPARNIHLRDICFWGNDRDVWLPNDRGIQHDWDMFDKGNAFVRLRGAEDCSVADCVFRQGGGGGIRVDLYGKRNEIMNNTLEDLGGTGILLCGYGPGRKDVNRGNIVRNNDIARVGRLFWHAPAIFLWQSGDNRIVNNRIRDLHYNGIVLSGVRPRFFKVRDPEEWGTNFDIPSDLRENTGIIRWDEVGEVRCREDALRFAFGTRNLVADNEIHNVMKTLGDGNAIYLSCSGPGNCIRRNLIYDCPRVCSEIRFDDDQEDSVVEQNVIIGNGIKLKHRNSVVNNIIIGGGIILFRTAQRGCVVKHNVVCAIHSPDFLYSANPELVAAIGPDENCYFSPEPEVLAKTLERVRSWGCDRNSVLTDIVFENLAAGDFRFAAGSPARALGIAEIDPAPIGLANDPAVRRLAEAVSLEKHEVHYFVMKGGE